MSCWQQRVAFVGYDHFCGFVVSYFEARRDAGAVWQTLPADAHLAAARQAVTLAVLTHVFLDRLEASNRASSTGGGVVDVIVLLANGLRTCRAFKQACYERDIQIPTTSSK